MGLLPRHVPPVIVPGTLAALWEAWLASNDSHQQVEARLYAALTAVWQRSVVRLTDSGTSALRLALTLAAPHGALVAIPAYGCIDVAAAVQGAGQRALLYDLDPSTLAPDQRTVDAALAQGAQVVVASHLFGLAMDLTEVQQSCAQHGAVFIEDAAQAFGSRWRGDPAGALGDYTVVSFGRGKGIGGGGGGALLARSAAASDGAGSLPDAQRISAASSRGGGHGGGRGADARAALVAVLMRLLSQPSVYALPSALPFLRLGAMTYHPSHEAQPIGRLSAALAASGLERIQDARSDRERRALRLISAAHSGTRGFAVQPAAGSTPGWLRLPIRQRDNSVPPAALGVYRAYPRAVPEQTEILDCVVQPPASVPGALELARTLVTLPVHARVAEQDLQRLEQWLGARQMGGARG